MGPFVEYTKCITCRRGRRPCTLVDGKMLCLSCRRILRGLPPREYDETNTRRITTTTTTTAGPTGPAARRGRRRKPAAAVPAAVKTPKAVPAAGDFSTMLADDLNNKKRGK